MLLLTLLLLLESLDLFLSEFLLALLLLFLCGCRLLGLRILLLDVRMMEMEMMAFVFMVSSLRQVRVMEVWPEDGVLVSLIRLILANLRIT